VLDLRVRVDIANLHSTVNQRSSKDTRPHLQRLDVEVFR
jgi:hypothetical protein